MNEDKTTSLAMVDGDIQRCLEVFCEREGISDLRKVPQTVWTYCMTYIGMTLFKKKHGFFHENILHEGTGACKRTTNGAQRDSRLLEAGTDYYIALCRKYDKVATLAGLCEFLGVAHSYFGEREGGDPVFRRRIKEKIYNASEATASEALLSGNRTPMSVLPYLNHYHGWSRDVSMQSEEKTSGVEALPDLSGYLEANDD